MAEKKTSVIIVNFNAGKFLMECVRVVLSSSVPVEVLISDNGSTDESISLLEKEMQEDSRYHVFKNKKNIGFASANNRVVSETTGEYILFLNPDCIVKPDTIERAISCIDSRPDVGMAGCLLRNLDGSEQAGCRRRVPTPWRTLVRLFYLDKLFPNHPRFQNIPMLLEPLPDKPIEVEAISGSFMLVRRTALDDVGLMDEGYFLHCEDLDWCMRFRQKGWKILFMPDVEATHIKGACSHTRPVRVEWHKHKGMVRFYRKFFRHQYPLLLMWLVICAVWLRFVAVAIVYSFRRIVR